MIEVTLRHRLEYVAYRSVAGVLGVLPERVALSLCGLMGWAAGVLLRIRRADVDRHLALAFPERDRAWRDRVARASYRHLAREAAMTLRLSRMDAEEVVRRTTMEGFDELRSAVEAGGGVIAITGHLGNWEIGAAAVAARGLPTDVVAHRQKNPLFDDHFVRTRARLGLNVIVKNEAARLALRSLAAGRLTAFVADQNIRKRGVFIEFFGEAAATAKGPALFALRSGAPVFLGVALRVPGWPSRYRVAFERVEVPRDVPVGQAVPEIMQRQARVLERRIRESPDQYFWQHRRWKTRPPVEPR